MKQAAVIIPAYNEERYIAGVVEAAQNANIDLVATEQIIVVDNNSTDRTAEIALSMGAIVLDCEVQGKGQSMDVGVEHARQLGATVVTFLDSDLTDLKGAHIDKLTEPVVTDKTPMTAGIIDLWDNWLLDRIKWPSLSGQRSIRVDYWDRLKPKDKRGFYVETAINVLAIEGGWFDETQQVRLEGVNHDGRRKIHEQGILRGSAEYIKVYANALHLYSRAKLRSRHVTEG